MLYEVITLVAQFSAQLPLDAVYIVHGNQIGHLCIIVRGGKRLGQDLVFPDDASRGRITSYNVCYTKLLRAYLGNVISEYFKAVRRDTRPVFYAAVEPPPVAPPAPVPAVEEAPAPAPVPATAAPKKPRPAARPAAASGTFKIHVFPWSYNFV